MAFLDEIVAWKRKEVEGRRQKIRPEDLSDRIERMPSARGFRNALRREKTIGLIAELKKASPSKGTLRSAFDPSELSASLEKGGASALSVLTDERFFQGHLDYLAVVRGASALPILEKDFILDPYQVIEARASGADAILLIAALLDDAALQDLHRLGRSIGLDCLVEIHTDEELDRVNALDVELIGINNRDLETFEVEPLRAARMAHRVAAGRTIVAESGIRSHDDVRRLSEAGVHAILIGEAIMRQENVTAAVRSLLGRP